MSVYRPRGKDGRQAEFRYDFWIAGRRFSGGTGCTRRDKAEDFERREKGRIKAEIAAEDERRAAPMTINVAASRFYNEVSQFYRGNAAATFDASLDWLVRELGAATKVGDITNARVAELVARRRGEGVSPATVNRTVTEPLRRVLRKARDAWDQAVNPIRWREHILEEPRERIRSITAGEEEALMAALPEDYRPLVAFALLSGFRLAECVGLRWSDIDWGGRRISVVGKGQKVASIPLTGDLRESLWPLRGRNDKHVFCYRAAATVHRGREVVRTKGKWYPITYEGVKTAWRRAEHAIPDLRFHDIRHTAATRMLRSGANLKLVQKLLRHEDIATTTKYAHADDEDLRKAMERSAESHRFSHTADDGEDKMQPKQEVG